MKKRELYNLVREEIVNELTIVNKNTASDKVDSIAKAEGVDSNTVRNAIKAATATGKEVNVAENSKTFNARINEDSDINEMARAATLIKIGDEDKIKSALELYSGTWKEKMIDLVKNEEGITQTALATALGKSSQQAINPWVREFLKLGIFVLSDAPSSNPTPEKYNKKVAKPIPGFTPTPDPKAKPPKSEPAKSEPAKKETPKPTPPKKETPKPKPEDDDEDVEIEDTWEKPEEDEFVTPDEPESSDIAQTAKEIPAIIGGKENATKLSPELEDKYTKIRGGINSKLAKLAKMSDKEKAASNDLKVLKNLSTNSELIKLFKSKGSNLKDLLSGVIG